MHLVDSGVWLALSVADHGHRQAAEAWFDRINEPSSVCFCRSTQQSFLRLLTTASVFTPYGNPPLANQRAWEVFDALLADFRVDLVVQEPVGLDAFWDQFTRRDRSSPKVWMDAYLAAFALSGGYQMVTTDAAFAQFDGLDLLVLSGS